MQFVSKNDKVETLEWQKQGSQPFLRPIRLVALEN